MRGGSEDSKFSQFQIFPKLGTGGGVIEFQIFPKFKKVQNFLGEGGGVKKIMDFFHNLGFFFLECFPYLLSVVPKQKGKMSLADSITEKKSMSIEELYRSLTAQNTEIQAAISGLSGAISRTYSEKQGNGTKTTANTADKQEVRGILGKEHNPGKPKENELTSEEGKEEASEGKTTKKDEKKVQATTTNQNSNVKQVFKTVPTALWPQFSDSHFLFHSKPHKQSP